MLGEKLNFTIDNLLEKHLNKPYQPKHLTFIRTKYVY